MTSRSGNPISTSRSDANKEAPGAPTLFFDLDGTLLDTQAGIAQCIRHALALLGRPDISAKALNDCFGPPLRISFSRLLNTRDPGLLGQAVTLFREHYLPEGIGNYRIYPGIVDLLERLGDLNLLVLTAKPQAQAEWLLADAGLSPYFQGVYGSEDQGIRSDKGTHLGHILGPARLAPQRCWMIGDRAVDMIAAKSNRVAAVAVRWGYGNYRELLHSPHDHLISRPSQIASLLGSPGD